MTRRLKNEKGECFTLFFTFVSPFSNFHPCKFELEDIDGNMREFNCVEQYYMFMKAAVFDDMDTAEDIFRESNPKKMKMLGKGIKGFVQSKWDKLSIEAMKKALTAKFSQNATLRKYLFLSQESKLVEASPMDNVWGIGLSMDAPDATNPSRWRGTNRLGVVMSEVRDDLAKQFEEESTALLGHIVLADLKKENVFADLPYDPAPSSFSTPLYGGSNGGYKRRHADTDPRDTKRQRLMDDYIRTPRTHRDDYRSDDRRDRRDRVDDTRVTRTEPRRRTRSPPRRFHRSRRSRSSSRSRSDSDSDDDNKRRKNKMDRESPPGEEAEQALRDRIYRRISSEGVALVKSRSESIDNSSSPEGSDDGTGEIPLPSSSIPLTVEIQEGAVVHSLPSSSSSGQVDNADDDDNDEDHPKATNQRSSGKIRVKIVKERAMYQPKPIEINASIVALRKRAQAEDELDDQMIKSNEGNDDTRDAPSAANSDAEGGDEDGGGPKAYAIKSSTQSESRRRSTRTRRDSTASDADARTSDKRRKSGDEGRSRRDKSDERNGRYKRMESRDRRRSRSREDERRRRDDSRDRRRRRDEDDDDRRRRRRDEDGDDRRRRRRSTSRNDRSIERRRSLKDDNSRRDEKKDEEKIKDGETKEEKKARKESKRLKKEQKKLAKEEKKRLKKETEGDELKEVVGEGKEEDEKTAVASQESIKSSDTESSIKATLKSPVVSNKESSQTLILKRESIKFTDTVSNPKSSPTKMPKITSSSSSSSNNNGESKNIEGNVEKPKEKLTASDLQQRMLNNLFNKKK